MIRKNNADLSWIYWNDIQLQYNNIAVINEATTPPIRPPWNNAARFVFCKPRMISVTNFWPANISSQAAVSQVKSLCNPIISPEKPMRIETRIMLPNPHFITHWIKSKAFELSSLLIAPDNSLIIVVPNPSPAKIEIGVTKLRI